MSRGELEIVYYTQWYVHTYLSVFVSLSVLVFSVILHFYWHVQSTGLHGYSGDQTRYSNQLSHRRKSLMYSNHTHNTTYMENDVFYTRSQALFCVRIHHLEELGKDGRSYGISVRTTSADKRIEWSIWRSMYSLPNHDDWPVVLLTLPCPKEPLNHISYHPKHLDTRSRWRMLNPLFYPSETE